LKIYCFFGHPLWEAKWNDGILEQWNDGKLSTFVFHLVEKEYGSWDKPTMDRKKINCFNIL
jgi:hypothetical protein